MITSGDVEAARVQVLGDGDMSERKRVVGAVEVTPRAVPEARSHDGDPAAGGQRLAEPGQRRAHGVLGAKMLQDVRHEHAVEIAARQRGIGDAARHGPDARVPVLVAAAHVDRPPLSSGNRVDELTPARARVEDPGRPAGLAVQVDGDLRPDSLPERLVHAAQPVVVKPLVVDAHPGRLTRSAAPAFSSRPASANTWRRWTPPGAAPPASGPRAARKPGTADTCCRVPRHSARTQHSRPR